MSTPEIIAAIAALEREATLPQLEQLLTDVVPEEDRGPYPVRNYGRARGTILDALGRVDKDKAADGTFAATIYAGALVRVVAAQEERISELEASVKKLGKSKRS
jgi:hypothetical protein